MLKRTMSDRSRGRGNRKRREEDMQKRTRIINDLSEAARSIIKPCLYRHMRTGLSFSEAEAKNRSGSLFTRSWTSNSMSNFLHLGEYLDKEVSWWMYAWSVSRYTGCSRCHVPKKNHKWIPLKLNLKSSYAIFAQNHVKFRVYSLVYDSWNTLYTYIWATIVLRFGRVVVYDGRGKLSMHVAYKGPIVDRCQKCCLRKQRIYKRLSRALRLRFDFSSIFPYTMSHPRQST